MEVLTQTVTAGVNNFNPLNVFVDNSNVLFFLVTGFIVFCFFLKLFGGKKRF